MKQRIKNLQSTEKEREKERERNRQMERERYRQTDRDRETERQTETETKRVSSPRGECPIHGIHSAMLSSYCQSGTQQTASE